MAYQVDDTIVAIASAPGGADRGIIRLSGPRVRQVVQAIFLATKHADLSNSAHAEVIAGAIVLPPASPERAAIRDSDAACDGAALPADLYYWPTARSYTRQPTAELHTLGSPPLLAAVLASCCKAGARLAAPGEFTMRAFLAGRLDLTQAEAVLGVIDARDGRQLNAALRQLAGGLAQPLQALRERLLNLLAHLEAGLDFVEEDIQFIGRREIARELAESLQRLAAIETQLQTRADARVKPRVVLVGAPNAGKSSLFNRLAGGNALVSSQRGTTRDYVSAEVRFGQLAVDLIDTAGQDLAQANDEVGRRSQQIAIDRSREADLVLWCIDSSGSAAENIWNRHVESGVGELTVLTKCDLPGTTQHLCSSALCTSAVTGVGLAELERAITEYFSDSSHVSGIAIPATAARCRESVWLAREALVRAAEIHDARGGEELLAVELRCCLDELGAMVGAVYTDDILDRIFSRFCIGK